MLYDFQEKALELTKKHNRVLYAYDMGLGKTYIGAEKAMRLNANMILVVCQKSKISDWLEHFQDVYGIETFDLTKSKQNKPFICHSRASKFVGVINYDLIWRRSLFNELRGFSLILDESSLIQNEKSKRAKAVLGLEPQNVIMLSGTVINGNYEKLWSQCSLLGWSISKRLFYQQFVITKKFDFGTGYPISLVVGYKNVDRLKTKLAQFGCIFKKTEDVMELPSKQTIFIKVKTPSKYRQFDKDKVIDIDGNELVGDYKLTERLYKRFLCGWLSQEKLKAFKDLVDSTSDRLIVFYNFNEELKKLKNIVSDRPVSIVNGATKDLLNYKERENSITFVQYQAGAMGLNLQLANKVIFFTLPEGQSELFEQSKKRIHRIGQNSKCLYYVLECENTIEQEIWNNLENKKTRTDYLFDNY